MYFAQFYVTFATQDLLYNYSYCDHAKYHCDDSKNDKPYYKNKYYSHFSFRLIVTPTIPSFAVNPTFALTQFLKSWIRIPLIKPILIEGK